MKYLVTTCIIINIYSLKINLENKTKLENSSNIQLTNKFCNPLCQECASNDLNYCTICKPGVIFYQQNCMIDCPEGTFLDMTLRTCLKCSDNCPVCWGPNSNMCGLIKGINSNVVSLMKEIIQFMSSYTFTRMEIDKWINDLKNILTEEKFGNIIDPDMLTTNQVYNTDECEKELPVGSFSKFNGAFIPVPAYINREKQMIESHWVYKPGTWDGKRWNREFYNRLPLYIRYKGEKNKIYFENNGYWIYNPDKDWLWIKNRKVFEPLSNVHDTLIELNGIKFELGNYAMKKISEGMEIKRLTLQNNMRSFFDKFLNTNKIIFKEFRNTIKAEQFNFINKIDILKNKVKDYFGEESLKINENNFNSTDISLEELEKQLYDDCDDINNEKITKNVVKNNKNPVIKKDDEIIEQEFAIDRKVST